MVLALPLVLGSGFDSGSGALILATGLLWLWLRLWLWGSGSKYAALAIVLALALRVLTDAGILGLISRLRTRWHRACASPTPDRKNGYVGLGFRFENSILL